MSRKGSAFVRVILLVLLLVGCELAPENEFIRGSGVMASEAREVQDVRGVVLATLGKLVIDVGSEEALTIEAEENLLPYLETTMRGDVLTIGTKPGANLQPRDDVIYHLTVTSLASLEVASSGDIEAPSLQAERFTITSNSSGDIHVQQLDATRLDVTINSSGDIRIDDGAVAREEVEIHSSGLFIAEDVQCEDATVEISSSGEATLWVDGDLQVQLSSSGDLKYYGDADVHKQESSSGRVIALGDH